MSARLETARRRSRTRLRPRGRRCRSRTGSACRRRSTGRSGPAASSCRNRALVSSAAPKPANMRIVHRRPAVAGRMDAAGERRLAGEPDGPERIRGRGPRAIQALDGGVADRREPVPPFGRPGERGAQALLLPGAATSGPLGRSVGHGRDSSTRSRPGPHVPTGGLRGSAGVGEPEEGALVE